MFLYRETINLHWWIKGLLQIYRLPRINRCQENLVITYFVCDPILVTLFYLVDFLILFYCYIVFNHFFIYWGSSCNFDQRDKSTTLENWTENTKLKHTYLLIMLFFLLKISLHQKPYWLKRYILINNEYMFISCYMKTLHIFIFPICLLVNSNEFVIFHCFDK